jgi:hypothetical protein
VECQRTACRWKKRSHSLLLPQGRSRSRSSTYTATTQYTPHRALLRQCNTLTHHTMEKEKEKEKETQLSS